MQARPVSDSSKPLALENASAYVEALENRLKAVEAQLEEAKSERSPGVQLISNAIHRLNSPFPKPHADDLAFAEIDKSFATLSINNTAAQGFQGKSSGAMLVKAAVDLKNGPAQETDNSYQIPPSPVAWDAPDPAYTFPEPDLLHTLVSLYFAHVNAFLPLLHFPTFEASLRAQLHLRHGGFAKTLLLVCAVGARYSGDLRVSISDTSTSTSETAGWKWFDQVELSGHLVRSHPTLYDLQTYCLAAEFLDCTSSPRTCWTLVGFGMRLSQDVGAHRFRMRTGGVSFEQELEKRASWILFLFDAQISTALGRCIALQSHDFDIEMPIVCDDEYWNGLYEPVSNPSDYSSPTSNYPRGMPDSMFAQTFPHPGNTSFSQHAGNRTFAQPPDSIFASSTSDPFTQRGNTTYDQQGSTFTQPIPRRVFTQPADKPSRIAFFNCMLQLNRILSFSCKILYSTNRSKTLIGLGDDKWEEQVVVELDSALNTWFETIPNFLRWDPEHPITDDIFFDQSAILHCTYYHTRIVIHRPFIPAMRRAANPTTLPSLAICNTAARACSHVAQIQQERRPNNPLWFSQTPLFTSGIVLLLNIWGGTGGGGTAGAGRILAAEKDMEDVHRCMEVLRAQRRQWPSAGALLDTLRQLVAVDHPLINSSVAPATTTQPAQTQSLIPINRPAEPLDLRFETDSVSPPPAVLLSPPMYDPHLETAPPNDFFDDDGPGNGGSWYESDMAGHNGQELDDNVHTFGDNGMPSGAGYLPSHFGHAQDGGAAFDAGVHDIRDFPMDGTDTHTIALWSNAPNGFGVADWDMYLGQFGEQVGSGQHPQY